MKNGTHSSNGLHLQKPSEQAEEWRTADCFLAAAQAAVRDVIAKQLEAGLPVPVSHEGRVVDLRVLKPGVANDILASVESTELSSDEDAEKLVVAGAR